MKHKKDQKPDFDGMSVRFPVDDLKRIGDLASQTGLTKSELIRRCAKFVIPRLVSGAIELNDFLGFRQVNGTSNRLERAGKLKLNGAVKA